MYTLVVYLAIVNKVFRHCHFWLAGQYLDVCFYTSDPVEVNVTGASNITSAEPIVINVSLNGR